MESYRNTGKHNTQKSQEFSPFPANGYKAATMSIEDNTSPYPNI